MATEKWLKRNDTAPPISITCLEAGVPKNLTGAASARLLLGTINAQGVSTTKVSGTMTFDPDRTTGKVYYSWAVGDLDTAGDYKVEVEITWADATKQTFPEDGYLIIHVVADVG